MRAEDVANAILFALRQPPNVNVREIWLAPTAAVR
jgi:NADP-dependent 3-hydroxy acid dehydrogenase YdfG